MSNALVVVIRKKLSKILDLARNEAMQAIGDASTPEVLVSQEQVFQARREVLSVHLAPDLEEYLVQLVLATRDPSPYSQELVRWMQYGASPRGTIALDRCARAHAWLHGREYVSPEDMHAVAFDVLRHRVLLSFEAEAEGVDTDHFIRELLRLVPVP